MCILTKQFQTYTQLGREIGIKLCFKWYEKGIQKSLELNWLNPALLD